VLSSTPAAEYTAPWYMISGTPSSSRSWIDRPVQLQNASP
jgi:hypothetical protein